MSAVMAALLIVPHPRPRSLLRLRGGTWNRRLMAVALGVAPFLCTSAWVNVSRQLEGSGPHAELGHWAGAAALPVTLLLLGFLAATGRAGWRLVTGLLAVTYGYLGVAALLLPHHDGSWGVVGGVIALASAAGYAAMTVPRVSGR